ncbi:MAG: V-type ATP synthase subunit A [Clostridia bacterium]|nr:V-type ATP synthase subunit A [Clostridia bacterium]
MNNGKIVKVAGPLVVAEGLEHANMFDVVHVGRHNLIGEIIEMRGDKASIQVYEETSGVAPGDVVETTGAPLSVELAPGLMTMIYDGIQRPLEKMREISGSTIERGVQVSPLDKEKKWDFVPKAKRGDKVRGGDVLGTVKETIVVEHRIMVPNGVEGELVEIKEGSFTIEEPIAKVRTADGRTVELPMLQRWPVRVERPYERKLAPEFPMITGQRIVDTLFPIAKGGTAAIPGPFGSGKTVTQHQLAKWSDVDIVVYVGCGERGNEMTDVLREFPELLDPRTGESLMQRTVLIANTSDMPVAAREASVYTGITIAEYYRDMGYNVAVIADSTSRWAEALREMSGRLEEMPGEEGYPAYLASRLAQFYERAGRVVCKGTDGREGTLSAIGAVSPPGGDISEPVSQATLRIVKVYWGLDSSLAYRRHFPAINWLSSYSLYFDRLKGWYDENISASFIAQRNEAMRLLQQESELEEIVKLVGIDALGAGERLIMETAQMIREDFLQQNAMSDTDSYCSVEKQFGLLGLILLYHDLAQEALRQNAPMNKVFSIPARDRIGRAKDVPQDKYTEVYRGIERDMRDQLAQAAAEGGGEA